MKKAVTILLGMAGGIAVVLGAYFSWDILSLALYPPQVEEIIYSSKQIDVLAETAKTLIPTVAGFAVLAASGVGYLHNHGHLGTKFLTLGVLSIFVAVIYSVACWIHLLGLLVDCSRPFDQYTHAALLDAKIIRRLSVSYVLAVASAKVACISFFYALDVSLLIAVRVFSEQSKK